ncbi:cytochrome P450 [Nemania sp. FL0031]|nr:cytochrome P450 [Nemania sp. FL0031]
MEGVGFVQLLPRGVFELLTIALLSSVFAYLIIDAFMARRAVQAKANYPLVGSPVSFMPLFVHNLLYLFRAAVNARDGYTKFKDRAFQLLRYEGSVVVLPHTLLDELATLPETIASQQSALSMDLAGPFTGLDMIVENRLNNIIIQRRLTPRLRLLIPRMEQSTREIFDAHFPKGEGWTEIQPFHLLKQVSASLAATVIVGSSLRNDPTWLGISAKYTENVFITSIILRMFPCWMHNIIYPFLPSYWRTKECFKSARQILGPEIQKLIHLYDSGTWEPKEDDLDDLNVLRWLCGMAKGNDRNPDTISHILVLLVLASVHNNLFRIVSVLYDVTAAGSELNNELVAEIAGAMDQGWDDMPYDRLYRLDSVLCESQRLSPPSVLGMKRLFKLPHTFRDGTYVAAGTYTCMATTAIENDPANTPNPETYDGLRRFRALEQRRQAGHVDDTVAKEFRFSTPSATALNWGYGKLACPGRHFASCVIKMVLVKLLADYEFAFCPNTHRPRNMNFYDFTFIFPDQKMLMRPKEKPLRPF